MGKHREAIKLAIKDELLGRFRSGTAVEGATLSTEWLYNDFLPSLDQKEESALEEVIGEMIAEGLIEHVITPKPTYRLTKKGADILC